MQETVVPDVTQEEVVIPEVINQETVVPETTNQSDQLLVEEQMQPPISTTTPKTGRKRKNQSPSQSQQQVPAVVTADTSKNTANSTNITTTAPAADEKVAAKAARTMKLKAQLEARKKEAAKTATEKEEPVSKKSRADDTAIDTTANPLNVDNSSNLIGEDCEVIEHEVPTIDDTENVSKKARVEESQSLIETVEEVTIMNEDNINIDVIVEAPPAQVLDVENAVVNEMEVIVEDIPEALTDIQDIETDSKISEPPVDSSNEKDKTDVEPAEKKIESKLSFFKNPSLSQNTFKTSGNEKSIFKSDSLGLNPTAIPFKPAWSLMPVDTKEGEEKTAAIASQSFFVQKNPTPQSSPRGGLFMPILKDSLFRKTPTSQIEIDTTSTNSNTISINDNDNDKKEVIIETAIETEGMIEFEKSNVENNIELEDGEIAAEPTIEIPTVTPIEIKTSQIPISNGGRGSTRGTVKGRGKGTVSTNSLNNEVTKHQPLVPSISIIGEVQASTTQSVSSPIQANQESSTQSSSTSAASQAPTTQPKHFRDMTDQEKKAYREKLMAERAEKLQKEKEEKEKGL
jgi:hypothetical protein